MYGWEFRGWLIADVLQVLSEGEVSSFALQFAGLKLLELGDFTNSPSGRKVSQPLCELDNSW